MSNQVRAPPHRRATVPLAAPPNITPQVHVGPSEAVAPNNLRYPPYQPYQVVPSVAETVAANAGEQPYVNQAASSVAAAYLRSQPANFNAPGQAPFAEEGQPNELDRRARDALAIIQLRLLREKLRKEREALNSSSSDAVEDDSESSAVDDTEFKLNQAVSRREELLRQIEELRFANINTNKTNSRRQPVESPRRVSPPPAPPQPLPPVPPPPPPPPPPSQPQYQPPPPPPPLLAPQVQVLPAPVLPPQIIFQRPVSCPLQQPTLQLPTAPIQPSYPSSGSMGDKYQDLMEMMMMQSYQMQQMVMQQALLGAVTNGATGGGAAGPCGSKPAIVQIAGKRHRHGCRHHSCNHGGACGGGGGDGGWAMNLPNQQMMPMGGQGHGQSRRMHHAQNVVSTMSAGPSNMYQRQQRQQHLYNIDNATYPIDAAAMEGDPLALPKDRRREIQQAKVGEIDWTGPDDNWWKRERVAVRMRHFFYVAWFIGSLKASAAQKGKTYATEKIAFDDTVVFEIVLREVIAAIHRIYLDTDSEMNQLLQTLVSANAIDLRLALRDSPEALQELVYLIENITFQMTYIQPTRPMLFHFRSLIAESSYDLSRSMAPLLPLAEPNIDEFGNPVEPPTYDQIEEAIRRIEDLVLNLTYHMTGEIPEAGVLGTHRKSHLFTLIKDGQLFPPGDFWDIEKKLLRFDVNGRTVNIGTREAMLLLMMMFLARGLVWTLLLHPVDYGLTPVEPDPVSKENLKLVASIFIYLYRRLIVPRDARVIPPVPGEIATFLVRDEILQPLYERIENTIQYCDGLVREWSNAYVRRLKQALPPRN